MLWVSDLRTDKLNYENSCLKSVLTWLLSRTGLRGREGGRRGATSGSAEGDTTLAATSAWPASKLWAGTLLGI